MANHTKTYWYKDERYSIQELSDISGVDVRLLRNRLAKGYSVEQSLQDNPIHDSILAFDSASYWEEWIGLSSKQLYEQYWKWCVNHDVKPVSHRLLMTQLLPKYNLHIVPMTVGDKCNRYIRQKVVRDQFGRML